MDVQMLELLLEENLLYDGVDKNTFLERLEELFDEFKSNKDDRLVLLKGKSNSKNFEYNNESGYALVGNNSKCHTAFIFKETYNDIIRINHCTDFVMEDEKVKLNKRIHFNSGSESKLMIPVFDALSKKNKSIECKTAMDELKKYEDCIKYNDAVQWLIDNILLQLITNSIYEENEEVSSFNYWYAELKRYVASILYKKEVTSALEEFKNLEQYNEKERFNWLLKHEDLYSQVSLSCLEGPNFEPFNHEFFKPNFKIPDKIKLVDDIEIYVETEPFLTIIEFVIAFAKYYWPTLNKLCSETPLIIDDPDFEFSLAYFVKIRNNTK